MRTLAMLAVLSLTVLAGCSTTSASAPNSPAASAEAFEAAVTNPVRTSESRAFDASRKPAETLAFLGLTPGMDAADLLTGSGYWAQIMARVVGAQGSVTAWEPTQFYSAGEEKNKLDALIAASPGVTLARYPFEAFAPPPLAYDFALVNLSYHDLYWQSEQFKIPRTDPDAYLRSLYAAMRPGGVVGVIDHVGLPGDTRETVDKLHRIDPATVRADFARAGFKLEARSDLLANPADDHTVNVFDKAMRGKTDRFLYKFRKPKS